MKVVVNGAEVTVGWRYPNPQLESAMILHGLDPKKLKEMNTQQICVALGMKENQIPVPQSTECIIVDTGKQPLIVASVKRFYKDPYDKNKARVYSLSKALKQLYPGQENKGVRRAFWNAYLSRKKKSPTETEMEIAGAH